MKITKSNQVDYKEVQNSDMIINIKVKRNRTGATGGYIMILNKIDDEYDNILINKINDLIAEII